MKVLFSHQNFPGQFGGFAQYLAARDWSVSFATAKDPAPEIPWAQIIQMTPHRKPTTGVHRYARSLEQAMINGQAFANACVKARAAGLEPDIVIAHSGWGSGTFAKAVWPECRYVSYVEWFYRWPPVDAVVLDRRQSVEDGRAHALARNAPVLLDIAEADLVFCPTRFQADRFPERIRRDMIVLPDGVNTAALAPDPAARPPLPETSAIPENAEIVAYGTRGMEMHRGFPEFMRALSLLQKSRPKLHAIIAGADRVAYGPQLANGDSWKKRMLEELDFDMSRIHFTGLLPPSAYKRLMQSCTVFVYLTVPFVLSWSLIEAMSIGCAIVASNTAPVLETLEHGKSAHLVDHTDVEALAAAIGALLSDPKRRAALGADARKSAVNRFDSAWIYPARAQILERLIARP